MSIQQDILNKINETVFGHERVKKVLITEFLKAELYYYNKYITATLPESFIKSKTLLIGGSGTGKTMLVNRLCRLFGFEQVSFDASRLTPNGASGEHPDDIINRVSNVIKDLQKENPDRYLTSEGTACKIVIFIDEADKLMRPWNSSHNDRWQERTQSNILKVMEDPLLQNCTWVFAGAFPGLKDQTNSSNIGFFNETTEQPEIDLSEALLKFGALPELLGRIGKIVELDEFTPETYAEIIKQQLIPQKIEYLSYYKLENVEVSDKVTQEIAEKAVKSGQGVRYCLRELDKIMEEIEFEIDFSPVRLLRYNNE